MSYCRWSSDDFKSDVYVYTHVDGGWTTHIAGNRVVYKQLLPDVIELTEDNFDEWYKRHEAVSKMLEECDRVPIELPHAGETFSDATPGECADRLENLRSLGYVVPQYAIDSLREDQSELEREQQPVAKGKG